MNAKAETVARPWAERLAGAPISWGACEVPGWGLMPEPRAVLAEMAVLRLRGTELGPPDFLPTDPHELRALLDDYGLELVGGFVPLVLHERQFDAAAVTRAVRALAQTGAGKLVLALVHDLDWSPPRELRPADWGRLRGRLAELEALAAEHGLRVALHPHVGTLIETAAQVQRVLEELEVGWCLDTGHLLIGGFDPVRFARECGERVVHVHLKDVNGSLAAELRTGRLTLLQATRAGLFLPLGKGQARIDSVLQALDANGYDGWFVLEQDTAITADEPTVQGGPMRDARESIAFLRDSAPRTQEVRT